MSGPRAVWEEWAPVLLPQGSQPTEQMRPQGREGLHSKCLGEGPGCQGRCHQPRRRGAGSQSGQSLVGGEGGLPGGGWSEDREGTAGGRQLHKQGGCSQAGKLVLKLGRYELGEEGSSSTGHL